MYKKCPYDLGEKFYKVRNHERVDYKNICRCNGCMAYCVKEKVCKYIEKGIPPASCEVSNYYSDSSLAVFGTG